MEKYLNCLACLGSVILVLLALLWGILVIGGRADDHNREGVCQDTTRSER